MTVLIHDAQGKLLARKSGIPETNTAVLDYVGTAMLATGDPYQEFRVRVEDENHSGYWMIIGKR